MRRTTIAIAAAGCVATWFMPLADGSWVFDYLLLTACVAWGWTIGYIWRTR